MSNIKENEHSNDIKIAVLQTTSSHINETLNDIKMRLNQIESKMDSRFDKLDSRIWQVMILGIAGFCGTFALFAHAFKWI